jgi:hypothetical protein
VIRYFAHDKLGGLVEIQYLPHKIRAASPFAPGSLTSIIDRAIAQLPADTNGVVLEATATPGVVTVAVALKFHEDWTVTLAGDFQKGSSPSGRIEVIRTW